jgi:opacity protein-like surface antigen/disulfide oxidoreductase YuzD
MKKILAAALLITLPFFSNAQYNWNQNYFEVGLGAGIMNYSGELTNSIFDFKHLRPGGALFVRYNIGKFISIRGQAALGFISGSDADSKELRNNIRNLAFESHVFEGSLLLEANLMGYQPQGHDQMFSPYAFIGIGVFNFNPRSAHFDPNKDGEMVPLHDLNTEGQGSSTLSNRKPYSRTQISIPMGLGVKFAVNSHINIGFEIGIRPTFTDYLDDVGQTYPIDAVSKEPLYDQTPYRSGEFGDKSAQELFSDRSYEYIYSTIQNDQNVSADLAHIQNMSYSEYLNYITPLLAVDPSTIADAKDRAAITNHETYIDLRGGNLVRGDKQNDWYLLTMITVSYNFIDNGLVGFRKRRKRKAGCKSAQF